MTDSYNPALEALKAEEELLQQTYNVQQQQEQAAAQERNMQQKQEALEANQAEVRQPDYLDWVTESSEPGLNAKTAVLEGLIDTALGLGSMAQRGTPIPFTFLKDKWDKANPISEDEPLHATIRKVSGIAIPTIMGGGALSGAAKATSWFANLSGKAKLATDIGIHLGVDMAVTTASTSATDETLATLANEHFGWHLPWATKDSDSPDVKYWKQMFETAGLSVGVDLLGVMFGQGLKKGTQYFGKTPEAEALLAQRATRQAQLVEEVTKSPELRAIDDQIEALGSLGDDLTSEGEQQLLELVQLRKMQEVEELPFKNLDEVTDPAVNKHLTEQLQTEEGIRRLEADPQGVKGYDPFINTPSNPVAKAIPHPNTDPIAALVDNAVIDKYPTLNPRPAPIVTEHWQKSFMEAKDGSERALMLQDVHSTMPEQIEAIRGKVKISEEDIKKVGKKLATNILGTDYDTFVKDLNSMKKDIIRGQKFLDDDSFVVLASAFREAFDTMHNPAAVKTAAYIVKQAGNTVSDAARAANSMGDFFDVTRQMDIAWDNLELVATEIRASQFIAGKTLEAKKLIKGIKDNPRVGIKLQENREAFEEGLKVSKEQARKTIETLKDITKNHPEYRKAFSMAFDATNGDVHTLEKLFKYAQDNLGIINKGIYDSNPEIPSLILKGLNSVRHNSILSGLSAVRAMTGNLTMITVKPISVLTGSAPKGLQSYEFKRALATYGGLMENLTRARKVGWNDWKLAVANPQEAMRRGRADYNFAADDALEVMTAMKDGFKKEGKNWAVAKIQMAEWMSFWNNNPIVRWGVNAMYGIDGFTNSMMASGMARAKAYDELFEASGGAFKKADFLKRQEELYSQAFDVNGVLTDKAAKHASSEIALNLDPAILNYFTPMLDHVPALKAIFLFPRTGLNAVSLAWSFIPGSSLAPALSKAHNLFKATTEDEIMKSLIEHGIDTMDMNAFRALKSEYTGRQIMGSSLIAGTMLMAVNGQLTGNGPQDAGERRRMKEMGWKELSIKSPITGQWHSYKGFEPFAGILGLAADFVYHGTRIDQAPLEDLSRKLTAAISLNLTNATFLSGFEPLAGLMTGDETAWNRFFANMTNSMLPGAGARSVLNNVVTPQLKDVENEFLHHLANKNKFLFSGNEFLKDYLDLYTGEPIRYFEPLTAAANALMPAFKSNGGVEPWRQWMLETGWDGLQEIQTNPLNGQPVKPEALQHINNFIATKYPLVKRIEEMMNHPDGYWDKKIKEYKIGRGDLEQKDFPVKKLVVHQALSELHRKARKAGWESWKRTEAGKAQTMEGAYRQKRDDQLRRGDVKGAKETTEQMLDIISITK